MMKRLLLLINLILPMVLFSQTATQVFVTGSTGAYSISNNVASVVDPGIVVTANGNITNFTVSITGSFTAGDVLSYTGSLPTGITTTGWVQATRSIQFNGEASPTVWQEFLRRVTIQTTSATCFPEQRAVSFNFGLFYYNPLNEHFYQLTSSSSSWTNALSNAANSSYFGYQGYLATFGSAAENSFVTNFINANSWIGCSDNYAVINTAVGYTKYANQAASEGKFHWVSGPETGIQMRTGNASLGNLGSPVSGVYQNWGTNEPNDYSNSSVIGQEDYGHSAASGLWNDFPNSSSIRSIVEYGGMPNDLVTSDVVFTRTVNVNGAPTTAIEGGDISVCPGGSATLTLPSFPGTVNRWEYSLDNFLTSGVAIVNSTSTLSLTNITETRYYRAIVNTTSPSCSNLATSSTLITVSSVIPGNVIATTGQICAGGDASVSLFGSTGDILDWEIDDNSGFTNPTTISSTSVNLTYSIPTTGTWYFRARLQNGSCGSPVYSPSASVVVVTGGAPIGGTVSSDSYCGGSNSGTLTLSGYTGTISKWQRSLDNGVVWSDISNTSTTNAYSSISQTTLYRAVLTNGTCGSVNSTPGSVTVYNFNTTNNGPVCEGSTLSLGVTTTGGSGPYTFDWTGPNGFTSSDQNPDIENLQNDGAGEYSVEIGSPGCTITQTTTVSVNPAPTITEVTGASLCAPGTATIEATASTGTIRWFNVEAGGSIVNTGTSFTTPSQSETTTYYVESTNGTCASFPRQAVTVTVNETPTISSTTDGERCGTGTVTLGASASAGVVKWFDQSTGGTELAEGDSYVTPSISSTTSYYVEGNNNGCLSVSRTEVIATVNQGPTVSVSSQTNVSCNGGSNGSATISASGSTAPYTYSWSPSGGTAASATGLSAGVYTVTVTDGNTCSTSQELTISEPAALAVTASSQTNVSCFGGSNGAASVNTPTGGIAPYTYNWTPGNPTGDGTASVTGLSAGTWTCTITDDNACFTTVNFTLTQPPTLVVTPASQTNIACNGGATGAAAISTPTGGTAPYTYDWSPGTPTGDGTISVTGLTAGTWTCTVTDANGCTSTQSFTVTQPSALAVSAAAQTNVSCFGGSNGAASVNTPTGGTGPYTYNWTPGNPTGDGTTSVSGLPVGTWTCTVTDDNGCTASQSFTVTSPTALSLTAASQTNVSCFGGSNGAAAVNIPTGGTAPYSYNWTPGNPTGDGSASVTGLTAGTWTCTVTDANGCTSTQNFTLTSPSVLSVSAAAQTNVSCFGGSNGTASINTPTGGTAPYSYNWTPGNPTGDGSVSVTGLTAGTWTCTVTDANGCTSTQNFTLTQPPALVVTPASQTNIACNGGATGAAAINTPTGGTAPYSYNWTPGNPTGDGTTSVTGLTAGTWTCTVTDDNGCTSTQNFTLTQPSALTASIQSQTNTTCFGGSDGEATVSVSGGTGTIEYSWSPSGGNAASATGLSAGVYTVTITDENACSTSQEVEITEPAVLTGSTSETACSSITINGETFTQTGVYTQNLTNGAGCDSTLTLNITINNPTTASITETACDSYTLNGTPYDASGVYTQHLMNAAGCDSTLTLNLTINTSSTSTESATACESYSWNGQDYTQSGAYTFTTTNAAGCDSTATLNLTINTTSTSSESVTACESYSWNGQDYTESGSYTFTTTNAAGCDSTATLNLTINLGSTSTESATACESYSWNGQDYTESGAYTFTTTNAAGCDSVVTLNLTINSSSTSEITAIACDSYSFNGEDFFESGTFVRTLTNAAGCDSIVTLNLTINLGENSLETATACASYDWQGQTFTESGSYDVTFTNSVGCDSTITLLLEITQPSSELLVVETCDSYTLNGQTYSETGQYEQLLTNVVGCDSLITLNLVILNNTSLTTQVACNSFTWNGSTYTESGIYTFTGTNVAGCDSVATLDLTINSEIIVVEDVTSCDSYLWNGTTYTESGSYSVTGTSAFGCDSTSTLNLTINLSQTSEETASACDSYSWNGTDYTETGVYTFITSNALGCDSTITLNLTITNSTSLQLTETACGSYTLNSEVYTESGIYTQVFTNAAGCDSTITLDLTINGSIETSVDVTACDSYTWNTETFTISGVYTQSFTTVAGCDSTVTLNLTINSSSTSEETTVACESYSWNGTDYTQSGVYTFITENAAGCDSTITLNLTINQSTSTSLTQVACNSYSLNGTEYTESGVYTQVIPNAAGCDSTITLDLTINSVLTTSLDVSACDSYTWETDTYTQSGVYTQTYTTASGCDSLVTLNLTINLSSSETITASSCTAYVINGETFTESGTYTQLFVNAAGCDSVLTIVLTVDAAITTTLDVVGFQSYTANGTTYTETGVYSQSFTTVGGCDSVVVYNVIITLVAGDTNGDGQITAPEVAGDTNGDGQITAPEVAGDTNGNGVIDGDELAGDTNGDGQITAPEIPGDLNGDGQITAPEVEGDYNGDGVLDCTDLTLSGNQTDLTISVQGSTLTSNALGGVTYQWVNCSTLEEIAGATSADFTPTENGFYQVILTNQQYDCTQASNCVFVNNVGIAEQDVIQISMRPNPANEWVALSGLPKHSVISVLDASGRLVYTETVTNEQLVLQTASYATGIYLISIQTERGVYTKKLNIAH